VTSEVVSSASSEVDRAYSDHSLAELYDLLNPWGPSDEFYLGLTMSAASVLDVGCGTGALLRRARESGHHGRLCGLDPAAAMLDVGRARADIEWVQGDLASCSLPGRFDLVVMTGHAFQVLLTDDDIEAALAAMRSCLVPEGRVVFEIRNPLTRPWESWTPAHAVEAVTASGSTVRVEHQVAEPVEGDVVRFSETFTSSDWGTPKVSRTSLRFCGVERLAALLAAAGLDVVHQFGDWNSRPLTDDSPEIITIAAPAPITS